MPVSNTPQVKKKFIEGRKIDEKPKAVLLKVPQKMIEEIDKRLNQDTVKIPRTLWILKAIEKALQD